VGVRERLAQLATLRTRDVVIEGETFIVRESSAATFAEYGRLQRTDRTAAIAHLLRESIVVPDGEPGLSAKDATAIAQSQRVSLPLISAVMDLNGFGAGEGEAEKESIPG